MAQAYQDATPASRDEYLRLLEIVSVSLHAFAGALYTAFHPEIDLKPPYPPINAESVEWSNSKNYFVDFYHTGYMAYVMYPHGLLNVVGYWAETQVLGGVLLFERGPSGLEVCRRQEGNPPILNIVEHKRVCTPAKTRKGFPNFD